MAKYLKKDDSGTGTSKYYAIDDKNPLYGGWLRTADVKLNHGEVTYPDNDPTRRINSTVQPGENLELFHQTPSSIDSLFADGKLRVHIPNLLGLAVNKANEIGLGLTYSSDLSPHSSRLARRGMEMGVVSQNPHNPEAENVNDIGEEGADSYTHVTSPNYHAYHDNVPTEELQAAKGTGREIIRQMRTSRNQEHMGPQFSNPEGWYQPKLGE